MLILYSFYYYLLKITFSPDDEKNIKQTEKKSSLAYYGRFLLHFGGHLADLFATKIDAKIEVDFGSTKNTLLDRKSQLWETFGGRKC